MLLTVVPVGAMKLMVRLTVCLSVKVTAGKVTIPLLYVPPSDMLTPVKPGTMLSVIVTFWAVLGPLLTVEIV